MRRASTAVHGHSLPSLGTHRRDGVADRCGRLPPREAGGRAGDHPHRPHRRRQRDQLPHNCWDYNGGASELRMGKALRDGYRDKAFLMTKIDGRSKESATQQIEESLRRLQTDRIDLMQFHEVIRMTDPERVFGADGALEAVLAAQRAGKIRYIGFTGHKSPAIHLRMLDTARAHGFRFDAVQMPLNVMDAHYDSFAKQVVPVLVEQDIA